MKSIFYKINLITFLSLISFFAFTAFYIVPVVNKELVKLEEAKAKEALQKVVLLSKEFAKSIKEYKKDALNFHKNELKTAVNIVYSYVALNLDKNKVLNNIKKLRYGKNGYFFVLDYNYTMLSHPYIKRGTNLKNLKDIKGKYFIQEMVNLAKKDKEAFIAYWWKKNKDDIKVYPKLSFVKAFDKWKIIIGSGVYIDDIQKEIEKRKSELLKNLRKIVFNTKIGKSGYLFVFNGKGKMIIHPNSNIDGTYFNKLKRKDTGTYIFEDLVNAYKTHKKYLTYKWDKPDDKGNYVYDKISWIEYIPELDWYVCSSAYVKEFEYTANTLKRNILIFGLFLLVLLMAINYFIIKKVIDPIKELSKTSREIAKGNYSKRVDINSNDEIGELAANFNTMASSIEEMIKNLDKKIKEKTKELENQKDAFEKLFFDISDGTMLLEKGKIVEINNAALNMLKYKKEDILNSHFLLVSDTKQDNINSNEKFESLINECKEKSHVSSEWKLVDSNGNVIYSLISFTSIPILNKEIIHVSIRDISDIKKMQEELIEAKEKAEESVKVKTSFLANMSHEIRTPMNGIIGMAHLALNTNLNDKQYFYLKRIESSAQMLLGIINDILDFSKIEAGKLNIEKIEFNLFDVIEHVVNLVMPKIREKNLEIIVDYDVSLGKDFYGDSLRITQILTNLVSNAVKFTHQGEIKIIVKDYGDDRVLFEVKDSGIGMTKEQVKKLFNAFTQADSSTTRKYGGTGLGLAISKKLVELMDGEIWVESIKDVGTSFSFYIKLPKIDKIKRPWKVFDNRSVLIIEDNYHWQEILENLFKNFGFFVERASNFEEAIAKVTSNKFDIITLDLNMPKVDGEVIAKEIRSINKDIPIIVISAYSKEEIDNKLKDLGIEYALAKPVNPSELNDILSDILLGTNKAKKDLKEKIRSNNLDISDLAGNILLAEDNITNQEVFKGLIENSNIKLIIANNGEEAVKKYKINKFDIIFMDIQMPIMDGFSATKLIREIDKDIPIIALTANAMKEDIEKTKKASMNAHLSKPIDVAKLYEILRKYLKVSESKKNKRVIHKSNLPDFKTLNKEKALKLVLGNEKIFLRILEGLLEYKDLDLKKIEDINEFKRLTHTIKGLSASAGADELFEIAKELDETQNRDLIPKFQEELKKVIDEIESKYLFIKERQKADEKVTKELLDKLGLALKSKKVKEIKKVIEEIDKYEFDNELNEKIEEIKKLVKKFKFKEALNLLGG